MKYFVRLLFVLLFVPFLLAWSIMWGCIAWITCVNFGLKFILNGEIHEEDNYLDIFLEKSLDFCDNFPTKLKNKGWL